MTRPGPKKKRSSSSRLSKADMSALNLLDDLVTEERRIRELYSLPLGFRVPQRIVTSLQQCVHCQKDIALMIFGDNAQDVTGLEAYARMTEVLIKQHNLPAYVIAPPSDPSSSDNPALLLKVYPTQEEPIMITPDEWLRLIQLLSHGHCPL